MRDLSTGRLKGSPEKWWALLAAITACVVCASLISVVTRNKREEALDAELFSELWAIGTLVEQKSQTDGDRVPALDSYQPPVWLRHAIEGARAAKDHSLANAAMRALNRKWRFVVPDEAIGKKLGDLYPDKPLVVVVHGEEKPPYTWIGINLRPRR